MRILLIMAFLLSILKGCEAQNNSSPPFNIGTSIPPAHLSNIINYTSDTINLEQFKHKLILLDFMATNCKGCIEKLPEMDSLQQKFGDKLQILLVAAESKEKMQAFLKSRWGKGVHLPIVTGDTLLGSWFPHRFLSHLVWIRFGKVVGITTAQYACESNINLAIWKEKLPWPVKTDFTEYDYQKPLLALNSENLLEDSYPGQTWYASFTDALQNIPPRYVHTVDTLKGAGRISMINLPAVNMWLRVFDLPPAFQPSHIQWQVRDSAAYIYDPGRDYRDQWWQQHTYCYEISYPLSISREALLQKMRADLAWYLKCSAYIKESIVPCLLLKNTGMGSGQLSDTVLSGDQKQVNIDGLLYALNQEYSGVPVIDETGFRKPKYFPFQKSRIRDRAYLTQALQAYGLTLVPAVRSQLMMTITDHY